MNFILPMLGPVVHEWLIITQSQEMFLISMLLLHYSYIYTANRTYHKL